MISKPRISFALALAASLLMSSPLWADGSDANPCGGDNPCADSAANPCAADDANPCAEKDANPCGGDEANPCGGDEDADEEDEARVSEHGTYEWQMSWGAGIEYGLFFTELARWNTHAMRPNGLAEFDVDFLGQHEIAAEISPFEGLRFSAFGGYLSSYGGDATFDAFYGGIEPAIAVRRDIWEFAFGAGFGWGGLDVSSDSRDVAAALFLARPFIEVRVIPTDYMAIYTRLGFNFLQVSDVESDLNFNEFSDGLSEGEDQLSDSGLYASVGLRFGSYPDHVKNIPDTDGDGLRDDVDDCKDDAEDMDNFEDHDGCPEADNDQDGVLDAADKCVDVPEDKDGWKDEDGCPETDDDVDNDKILDTEDKCPKEAEDYDQFEDEDGCPELDNDGDNIIDADDKCPMVPGVVEQNGCPAPKRVTLTATKIEILEKVFFELSKAEIKAESFPLLDEVAEVLIKNPQVKRIEIQGHTDSSGKAKKNQKLSEARAKSVMDYLIEKGVPAERLTSKGFGSSSPLVEYKKGEETPEAAEQNRRVEFVILEQDDKMVPMDKSKPKIPGATTNP